MGNINQDTTVDICLQPCSQSYLEIPVSNTNSNNLVTHTFTDVPQNTSSPVLYPGSIVINEPQSLSKPLKSFTNDDLSDAIDVSMGDRFYLTNSQPQNNLNAVAHPQFSSDIIAEMPISPTVGLPILDDPISFNFNSDYNAPSLQAEQNTALLQDSDNQNITTTEQVASKHQPPIRKRAPKAQVMTKGWKSAEFRIRELYVIQGKQVKDVRKIINKEFGFNATDIQYKQKIGEMKIQRRAEAQERRAIVLHTLYRKKALNKESNVRLRGHEITQEKLMRWTKEMKNLPELIAPPPSLSSGISVRSVSPPKSPRLILPEISQTGFTDSHSMRKDDAFANLICAMLRLNIQNPERVMDPRETEAVFKEVQKLLDSKPNTDMECIKDPSTSLQYRYTYTRSSPIVAQDILEIRNRMNIDQHLVLKDKHNNLPLLKFLDQQSQLSISRFNDRFVSWITDRGVRIDVSIYNELTTLMSDSGYENLAEEVEVRTHTAVAIVSGATKKPSYHVAFSFSPALPATVTFEATIPKTSEIFQIVVNGNVRKLREVLQQRTASLTDRDEEGRSLLNYAITAIQPEMIEFLLDNQADPNAIEISLAGSIGPVHYLFWRYNSEIDTEDPILVRKTRSALLLAGHGADFSIEACIGGDAWLSSGILMTTAGTLAQFQIMIDYGAPFIYPNSLTRMDSENISFLSVLSMLCSYNTRISYEIVDKAICLLRRGADANHRSSGKGDTLLHTIFEYSHLKEDKVYLDFPERLLLSVQAPLELLVAFISSGTNIFARNYHGQNPSEVAWSYGQEKAWHRALLVCGIDTEEFYGLTCRECHQCSTCPECSPKPPSSKLTFEAFCDCRKRGVLFNDLAMDEDERSWLHGDYINVPFNPEWLGREYHNPHGHCFKRYLGRPYFLGKEKDSSTNEDCWL